MDELREKIAAEVGRANGRSGMLGNLVTPMTLLCADAALHAIEEAGYVLVRKDEVYMPETLPNPHQIGRALTQQEHDLMMAALNLKEPRG